MFATMPVPIVLKMTGARSLSVLLIPHFHSLQIYIPSYIYEFNQNSSIITHRDEANLAQYEAHLNTPTIRHNVQIQWHRLADLQRNPTPLLFTSRSRTNPLRLLGRSLEQAIPSRSKLGAPPRNSDRNGGPWHEDVLRHIFGVGEGVDEEYERVSPGPRRLRSPVNHTRSVRSDASTRQERVRPAYRSYEDHFRPRCRYDCRGCSNRNYPD